jgi:hypothetical protein
MILTYPMVNDDGTLTGAEVSLRLKDIEAVKHMCRWTDHRGETVELIPDCVVIYTRARHEFEVKAPYKEIKILMIEFEEWA